MTPHFQLNAIEILYLHASSHIRLNTLLLQAMQLVWILDKTEYLLSRFIFPIFSLMMCSWVLYIIGSLQGLTQDSILFLLSLTGWLSAAVVIAIICDIAFLFFFVLSRPSFFARRLVIRLLQAGASVAVFISQSYIVLLSNI